VKTTGPQFRCFSDPSRVAYGIGVAMVGYDESRELCASVEWVPMPASHRPPIVDLTDEAAQKLMDTLWECGVRPAGGRGSAGQLAAVERHLNDMRALVRGHTGILLP
jgi:hypothetical protein